MNIFSVIKLLGGIAFFLFGMSVMGDGLKRAAGSKLEYYLWKLSSNPLKGFLLGLFVTAVIQSSGATSIMAVSFVNAGMMGLSQTIGIILGATLGTTMTGWILSISSIPGTGTIGQILSTGNLVSTFAFIGILLYFFTKKPETKNIGAVFMGLATLLLSMSLIGEAVEPLKESARFREILLLFSNPFLGMLAGIFMAVIIQSASAGVGVLQALSVTGALTYSSCVPLILGINLGASTPVILSMLGSKKEGKRTALVYPIANLLSIIVNLAIFYLVKLLWGLPFFEETASTMGIAVLNTSMRIIAVAVLLPSHNLISKIIYAIINDDASESEDEKGIKLLEESVLRYAPVAIEHSRDAVLAMAKIARDNVLRALSILISYSSKDSAKILEKEGLVDKYEDKLGDYIIKITTNKLSDEQQSEVTELLNVIGDIERLSDHAVNLCETAQEVNDKKIVFSKSAKEELKDIIAAVKEVLSLAFEALYDNNLESAYAVEPLEEVIDVMCRELKIRHAKRLQNGECTIETGFVFNDLLTNYERIADHCSNIAFGILHKNNIKYRAHKYPVAISNSEDFKQAFESYQNKYLDPIGIKVM